jgi:photosystem II stability/assembly factor-like uncharacterized protein
MKPSLLKYSILSLVVTLLSFSQVNAQGLNSVYTPDGIYVTAVGDNGLVFRSSNSGDVWAQYTYGSDNLKCVYAINDDVWIASSNGKVYKTFKGSSPLSSIQTGTTNTFNSVFFVNSSTGFVCGDGGVVYKTVNGGNNWTSSSSGISATKLNGIHFSDANNGTVVGDGGIIYVTNNGGSGWTAQTSGTTRNLLKVRTFSNGAIAVGEWGTLLTRNGVNWTATNSRTRSDIRGISGTSMTDLHICGGGGFIRNNTSGNTKFYNFETNPMQANLVDIFYFNSSLGFAVSSLNKVVIKTSNGGTVWNWPAGTSVARNWQQKLSTSGGIGNNLCRHPYNNDAVFVTMGNRVYLSWNRGDNWTQIATWTGVGNNAHSFYVNPNDTNIWLAAVESSPDKVIRSTNYGQTWTAVHSANFSNYGQPLEQDQNNPNTYYFAPDNGGFWKSTNMGANWTEISGNYPFRSPCDVLVMWDSSNVIFVGDGVTGSGQAKIFRSSNGGVNWTDVRTATASEIPSMCNTVFDLSKIYATEWSGSQIYRSTNYGYNFENTHSTGFSGWASDICHEDPTLIYTGNYGSNSSLSTNNGANWITGTSGMTGSGAGVIVPERGWIISQQTSNVYKMNITYDVITSVEETISSIIPERFAISQNYPNPFNPATKIKYDIPVNSQVVLKVFDVSGREVANLVNEFKNAGSYELNFNASNLTSGVYFYTILANDFKETKKMLLIK